jgi:hypothetical protein
LEIRHESGGIIPESFTAKADDVEVSFEFLDALIDVYNWMAESCNVLFPRTLITSSSGNHQKNSHWSACFTLISR